MLEFVFPWVFLAVPLPYLFYRTLPPHTETVEALRVPFFARLAELAGAAPERGAVVRRRSGLRWAILGLIWLATLTALAKPVMLGEPVTLTRSARDLMLAVDLSGSMDTRDLKDTAGHDASRLRVVKEVVADFIARRKGDRLGLMVFGAAPYLQVPFTQDLALVTHLLDETRTRMAGDSTNLGDAIGLAIHTFERSEAQNRVLVLLTDGNDTGSQVPPLTAARIAHQRGVTIHVIGVGDPTLAGEERLNEEVLSKIAADTGGRYFHAADHAELSRIYAELDKLEVVQFESRTYTPKRTVFQIPLAIAALTLCGFSLALVLPALRRRSRPEAV